LPLVWLRGKDDSDQWPLVGEDATFHQGRLGMLGVLDLANGRRLAYSLRAASPRRRRPNPQSPRL